MTTTTEPTDRTPRRPVDEFEDRRRQLADAALRTLSELGYARTTLREIAQNSEFSHGVLHYYFHDKVELITRRRPACGRYRLIARGAVIAASLSGLRTA